MPTYTLIPTQVGLFSTHTFFKRANHQNARFTFHMRNGKAGGYSNFKLRRVEKFCGVADEVVQVIRLCFSNLVSLNSAKEVGERTLATLVSENTISPKTR